MKTLSVIIPALNEEGYLGDTLRRVRDAIEELPGTESATDVEIIVVDNDSTDGTAEVARSLGAVVVPEPIRNIARARNVGGRAAQGEILLFLDADTAIPSDLLARIVSVMSEASCVGLTVGRYGGRWSIPIRC